MATITTINSGDSISSSRTVINTNFTNLNSDKIETSALDTDTTLAANSDSRLATQRAVKAYVDAGGNVNASETAKGIVEEATDAEVAAGTATGATGAKLFVTPAKLNASATSPIRSVTAGATITGATLPVPVYQNKTDNEFYACDANDTAAMKFLGFAISNGTNGSAMNVQFNGVVSGFTGLAEGEKYYVQDAVGTIGTTPGTYEVLVGVAISETQLLIKTGTFRTVGTYNAVDSGGTNATQDITITLGYRPSKIVLTMVQTAPTVTAFLTAVGPSFTFVGFNTTQYVTTVFSTSDTGFVIRHQQLDATPPTVAVYWEAEGEL